MRDENSALVTGWESKVTLEDVLKETIAYFRRTLAQ
jgi:hypothetical protein